MVLNDNAKARKAVLSGQAYRRQRKSINRKAVKTRVIIGRSFGNARNNRKEFWDTVKGGWGLSSAMVQHISCRNGIAEANVQERRRPLLRMGLSSAMVQHISCRNGIAEANVQERRRPLLRMRAGRSISSKTTTRQNE
ncbi:hypothetical protein QE152_g37093 [Popillia japonica]|uniref:Uncharacterized protein n=1 Tax=Popillia japonica TaxID=7064 RepID=A0AAW1IB99_POPJA